MAWENKKWRVEGITDDKLNARIRDNMNALKAPPSDSYSSTFGSAAGTLYSISSASFAAIDANYEMSITTAGGDIMVCFTAYVVAGTGNAAFDLMLDSARVGASDGLCLVAATLDCNLMMLYLFQDVSPGTHIVKPVAKVVSGTSVIRSAGASQMWAREIS